MIKAYVVNSMREGRWLTVRDIVFSGVLVPRGFDTDGASIPWGFQWLIKKGGLVFPCAVIHDYLYFTCELPREEADKKFLEAMTYNRVPMWKRQLMYRAVRLCGGSSYGRRKREGLSNALRNSG